MYGLIGKIVAVDGERGKLARLLIRASRRMTGCLSYVVAEDSEDENTLWVTEVWDSRASHEAALSLPAVREAVVEGRPLMAEFVRHAVTVPIGGQGLDPSPRAPGG